MRITPHFTWEEAACNDKDSTPVPEQYKCNAELLAEQLEKIRSAVGDVPIKINSWYRTLEYNASLPDASQNSQHLLAKAADLNVKGWKPKAVYNLIENLIIQGRIKEGGLGIYNSFVHYDIRGIKARWDLRK